jgi:hypothetical protein
MRKFVLAAALAAVAAPMPVLADPPPWAPAHGRRAKDHDNRDWREYRRYDYNRSDPRYGDYRADRYYRDGRDYKVRRLSRNDRIYRGNDGRYYCRRDDGTTGLIIGGLAGGLLGNTIAPGGSKTLGTILGGGAGAVLGRAIDRDGVSCR